MRHPFPSLLVLLLTVLLMGFPPTPGMAAVTSSQTPQPKTTGLPSYFSWRDINGVDFTTPIRSQGPYHSCETFALVAAVETMVQKAVGYPFGCDLSEAHLYFWSGGNLNWGSYPENDSNFLVNYGVPDEACWPYPHDTVARMYPLNTTAPNWQNRTVKISSWSYLPANNITAIKQAIVSNGPVPTLFHVYKDFDYYPGGVYRHVWGKSVALHLMCLVGFQDDPRIPSGGYWIVKNSWGTNFGENGWCRIAYGECGIEEMPILFQGVYGHFSILYVDGDNTMGPWDGSPEHPYQHIMDAVNASYDGWTVYVRNGTYREHLVLNKSVNIDGESAQSTIVDGQGTGDVIYIKAPGVRISGLTVRNSGVNRLDSGIRTLSLMANMTIENCVLRDCDVGLYLNCGFGATWNTVKGNTIVNCSVGIFSTWVDGNHILENIISGNRLHGIEFEACMKATIETNMIANNGGDGILFHGSCDDAFITHNILSNNSYGFLLRQSKDCKIFSNDFMNNDVQARFEHASHNTWRRNYWSDWPHGLPHRILGTTPVLGLRTWDVDWHPRRTPV